MIPEAVSETLTVAELTLAVVKPILTAAGDQAGKGPQAAVSVSLTALKGIVGMLCKCVYGWG